MKKFLFFFLLLMGTMVSQAYDFSAVAPTGQTLYYNINGTTVTVTYPGSSSASPYSGYTAPTGNLSIPETVTYNGTTYSVTSIGNRTFKGCSGLMSVTIPNSVTSIGSSAFYNCSGLTSVTIPNSVTSIGNTAFYNCNSLTSVTIPNSVTSIGYWAFYGCSGLTSVTIGNSVTSIGEYTFHDCSGLTSVTIGNSVTSIGEQAFGGCISLTSVTIPNSVTSIGGGAFGGCSRLTTIYSESPIAPTLGADCFYNCPIQEVHIPCGSWNSYYSEWSSYRNCLEEPAAPFEMTLQSENNRMGSISLLTSNCADTSIIHAVSNYGYHFIQWSDGDTNNPRTVVLTQDTSFTAEFDYNQYTINGFSANSTLGTVLGSGDYQYLDTVILTATAMAHYHFAQWQDGNTENPRVVVVSEDASYTAMFEIDVYHITVESSDLNMGYVSGGGDVAYGQPVTVEATAYSGYHFSCWSNGVTTNPYSFTLTQDTSLTAYFALHVRDTIYVPVLDTTYIEVHDTTYVDVFIHDTTYVNVHDTTYVSIHDTSYVDVFIHDTMVVTVCDTAIEQLTYYTLSVVSGNNNRGLVAGNGTFPEGTEVEIAAIPIQGNMFVQWVDGNTDNPRRVTVNGNMNYVATFEAGPVGVTEVEGVNFTIGTENGAIVVKDAPEMQIRIFDNLGRCLITNKGGELVRMFNMPATGAYMVQVGNYPAQKVVVVR